jgi:hypothetical protein
MVKRRARKGGASRGESSGDRQVFKFVRGVSASLTPQSTDAGRVAFTNLSSLPNITDITNLFDEYKIDWMEFTVHFQGYSNNGLVNYDGLLPWITTAVDYNDSTAPILNNDVLEYKNAEYFQFSQDRRSYTRRWAPRCIVNTNSGIATLDAGTWVSTASTSQSWLGMKYFIGSFNSVDRNHVAQYTFRVGLSCRLPR